MRGAGSRQTRGILIVYSLRESVAADSRGWLSGARTHCLGRSFRPGNSFAPSSNLTRYAKFGKYGPAQWHTGQSGRPGQGTRTSSSIGGPSDQGRSQRLRVCATISSRSRRQSAHRSDTVVLARRAFQAAGGSSRRQGPLNRARLPCEDPKSGRFGRASDDDSENSLSRPRCIRRSPRRHGRTGRSAGRADGSVGNLIKRIGSLFPPG